MKTTILLFSVIAMLSSSVLAQHKLNGSAGFLGFGIEPTGYLLEFEFEKFYKVNMSSPLRADLIYTHSADYEAVSIDIHKGFRKYFDNGLLLEQSIGAGLITTFYKTEMFYYDQYSNMVAHGGKPHFGFMPSVTVGIGYNVSKKSAKSNLIWIRPKVYWNLGFRGLNMPFYALQVGFTHNFKNK